MAFKSVLTFSRIIFEVELFELRDPEPGYNHFLLFCFVLFCFLFSRSFLTLKMGGSSFILAKGRVCWSPLQPWGALHDDTKNGCVADYARTWSRKEKIIPLATHWLNNWWQICRAYGYFLCDNVENQQTYPKETLVLYRKLSGYKHLCASPLVKSWVKSV